MIHQKENDFCMKKRCKNWDYHLPGTYMITITLANRSIPQLGEISHCEPINSCNINIKKIPTEDIFEKTRFTRIKLTNLGRFTLECWNTLPQKFKEIKIIKSKIMPDHLHGIIWIMKPIPYHFGEIIRYFKYKTTTYYKKTSKNNCVLWSNGFVDTILISSQAVNQAKEYIEDNPRRLALKTLLPNYFTIISKIKIQNLFPTFPNFISKFTGIGNKFLLDNPRFFQIQCSCNDFIYKRNNKGEIIDKENPVLESNNFLNLKCKMLEAGYKGATIVSTCISDGEKALTRKACNEGFPIILLYPNGFKKTFKPTGVLFNLCASGKLLIIAPAAWEYSPKRKQMTQEKAQILNRISQLIAKNDDIKQKREISRADDFACMNACKTHISD